MATWHGVMTPATAGWEAAEQAERVQIVERDVHDDGVRGSRLTNGGVNQSRAAEVQSQSAGAVAGAGELCVCLGGAEPPDEARQARVVRLRCWAGG